MCLLYLAWSEIENICCNFFLVHTDAAAVLAKDSHVLMNKSLDVLPLSTTLPKEEYERNKLLIKNIPRAVNEDMLIMFLDARLDIEHKVDYAVELKDGCAVVIFSKERTDEGMCIS